MENHPPEQTSDSPPSDFDDTRADLAKGPRAGLGKWMSRAGALLLVLIVLSGLTGLVSPRTDTVTTEGGGWTLVATYPQVTRAGQPAPLHVRLDNPAGFPKTIQLRFCDGLFDRLDFQNWYPNPAAETSTTNHVIYEFDPPPFDTTFEVSLDARSAPGPLGERLPCEVAVLEDDLPVASTEFTVWRLP